MPKSHCDHRVVIRNQEDQIVFDQSFGNFARAKPEYDAKSLNLLSGHELTLQHGARIIFKTSN